MRHAISPRAAERSAAGHLLPPTWAGRPLSGAVGRCRRPPSGNNEPSNRCSRDKRPRLPRRQPLKAAELRPQRSLDLGGGSLEPQQVASLYNWPWLLLLFLLAGHFYWRN